MTGGGRGNGWAVRKQGDRERELQGGICREDELGLLDFEGSWSKGVLGEKEVEVRTTPCICAA